MLHDKGLELKAKGFALGVRVEHSQELIDKIQYHGRVNDEFLPPATYSLVTQIGTNQTNITTINNKTDCTAEFFIIRCSNTYCL